MSKPRTTAVFIPALLAHYLADFTLDTLRRSFALRRQNMEHLSWALRLHAQLPSFLYLEGKDEADSMEIEVDEIAAIQLLCILPCVGEPMNSEILAFHQERDALMQALEIFLSSEIMAVEIFAQKDENWASIVYDGFNGMEPWLKMIFPQYAKASELPEAGRLVQIFSEHDVEARHHLGVWVRRLIDRDKYGRWHDDTLTQVREEIESSGPMFNARHWLELANIDPYLLKKAIVLAAWSKEKYPRAISR